MRILIIDNDELFLNQFHLNIEPLCKNIFPNYKIETFSSMPSKEHYQADIIFLDIDLDNANGIEVATAIKLINKKAKIIFITSKSHLVYNALAVQPFYFIRKSQLESDLSIAFSLLKDAFFNKPKYYFQYNGAQVYIYKEDVVYIEICDHLSTIYLYNKQEYHFYKPLSVLVKEIDEPLLCQVHKKYFVNLKYISLIHYNYIKLPHETKIPIGRKYKDDFMKKYNQFKKEGETY